MTNQFLSCVVIVYVPSDVFTQGPRSTYHQRIHIADEELLPSSELGQKDTSVVLHDVPDRARGGNGATFHLTDLANIAGYIHQHSLVEPIASTEAYI